MNIKILKNSVSNKITELPFDKIKNRIGIYKPLNTCFENSRLIVIKSQQVLWIDENEIEFCDLKAWKNKKFVEVFDETYQLSFSNKLEE